MVENIKMRILFHDMWKLYEIFSVPSNALLGHSWTHLLTCVYGCSHTEMAELTLQRRPDRRPNLKHYLTKQVCRSWPRPACPSPDPSPLTLIYSSRVRVGGLSEDSPSHTRCHLPVPTARRTPLFRASVCYTLTAVYLSTFSISLRDPRRQGPSPALHFYHYLVVPGVQ